MMAEIRKLMARCFAIHDEEAIQMHQRFLLAQAYTGSPDLLEQAMSAGISPEDFCSAYAHFALKNPRSSKINIKFGVAVASLSAVPTGAERTARAIELFGRSGVQMLNMLPVEKRRRG